MTEAGVAILVIGLVIVLSQGAMLLEGGREFLAKVYPNPKKANAAALLVVAPALLLTLGALLLVATTGVGSDAGIQTVLNRVGIIFLAAAAMHFGAIMMLTREKSEVEEIEETEAELGRPQH